jgi:uncharacterized membrane protein YbhN (UPF0104 family)
LLLKAILGLGITVALVVFLFRYIDLDQVVSLFRTMRWSWALGGLGLWVLLYLARTGRFVMVAPRTPFITMLCIASVHNFFLRLLPMRTGELSYAFLVKRAGTAGLGESLLGLLLLRAMDGAVVVVIFTVTLTLHQGIYLGDRRLSIIAAAGATVLAIALVVNLGRVLRLGLALLRGAARAVRLDRRPRVSRTLDRISEVVGSFDAVERRILLPVALLSVVQWILTFLTLFAIMRGFSMPVGIAQTVLGSTAAVVTGFLPIGGIGSFGTLEAGWALGFVLVGLEQKKAVASGFGASLTTFGYATILGLFGWIGLWLVGKRTSS